MEKVKPITEKLSTQEKIERALRIIENREEILKERIAAARKDKAASQETGNHGET